MNRLNVLISSVSKKVPLIKYVRKALQHFKVPTLVVGGDLNPECIGRYFVDEFIEIPHQDKLSPELFISLCQYHQINVVIPTRDGELEFFATHKERFRQEGIYVMVSDLDTLKIVSDKLQFYETLSQMGYAPIITSKNLDDFESDRFVVKERYGAGSRKIGLNLSKQAAEKHAKTLDHPIFQPFLTGREYSIDFYIDSKRKGKGVIVRSRDLIVDGESQITTTMHIPELETMAIALGSELGLYGHNMFQVILNDAGFFHVLECNPRFGGASTLSVEMGLDSFNWFFLEVTGKDLKNYPFNRYAGEKKLVRHAEDLFL